MTADSVLSASYQSVSDPLVSQRQILKHGPQRLQVPRGICCRATNRAPRASGGSSSLLSHTLSQDKKILLLVFRNSLDCLSLLAFAAGRLVLLWQRLNTHSLRSSFRDPYRLSGESIASSSSNKEFTPCCYL
jgi:hypothetical protein